MCMYGYKCIYNSNINQANKINVIINNNNTGHLLHAISPKSKGHIACYKHITNYIYSVAKHCYSYRTLAKHCKQNTHSSNSTADKGLRKTYNNGYIQAVSRQDGNVGFSSGSEIRHIIRTADLLGKRVPSGRGGV